jgi:hypothetical protein
MQALINISELFLAEDKLYRWGYFGLPFYALLFPAGKSDGLCLCMFSISTAG